jgi:uncharacterized repeat protein (TIGR01451 family)
MRLAAALLLLCAGVAHAQQTPIGRSARFTGTINFVSTGGTLRTQPNTGNACAVAPTSTRNLTGVPAGTSVRAAYLYWGGSGAAIDGNVTLNGAAVAASRTFTATYNQGGANYPFFSAVANVTALVTGNGSYTFGNLSVNTGAPHCAIQVVTGGWGLIVIYQGAAERLRAVNVFDGLQFFRGNSLTLTPDGFRIPPANIDGRVALVTFDGDPGNSGPLNGFSEGLTFNGVALDDGIVPAGSNPVVQQFDGTVNSQGVATSYGLDVDIYDVSAALAPAQTSATTVFSSGGDLVLLTAQVVSVTTEPAVDLGIAKSHTGNFSVGSNGVYTLRVSNAPGVELEDNPIVVTDPLPAGLTYVSATGAGWTCGAVAQLVTCTHPPTLAAGASLPDIVLTVAVGAAAAPSVTNTASVASDSFDANATNDSASDPTVVLVPNLSTSTKSVVDLNGGEANPGDVLRYTVTLIESAGAPAPNASVTDDVPGNVGGFSIVSIPAGATDASTGAGTGGNGTGFVDVSGFTVPANGSATVVFDVTVAAGATPGTPIDNTATIVNPNGPGATPSAPQVVVSPSQIPGSGSKALYLRRLPALQLSRNPPAATETNEDVPGSGSRTWTLTPPLQRPTTIAAGAIPVRLWLRRSGGGGASRTVAVTLANSATGVIGAATQTITPPAGGTPALFTFTLPNPGAQTFPAGSVFTLSVAQTAPAITTTFTRVHPNGNGAGLYSRIDLNSNTVVNVDSITANDAAFPGGGVPASFAPGATVYVRAVVSDPFGSFDIARANVTILDPTGVVRVNAALMAQVADSGAATRTYEYAYTIPGGAPVGGWTVSVVATEGTEGLVTDVGVGSFVVALLQPTLVVRKTSEVLSDPFNAVTDPKRIPGGVVRYSITVTNNGPGAVDASSLVITDPVALETAMFVAAGGGNPVEFLDGATPSGLAFDYATGVSYSSQPGGGAPYDYTPVPDADGFDANVRGVRVAPTGAMNGASGGNSPSFTIRFRVRVR